MKVQATAGRQFNRNTGQLYFIASGPEQLLKVSHVNRNFLCSVNEIRSEGDVQTLREIMANGANLFIDSGVYNLTMEHARANDCHMNEALALAPDEIDGFGELYKNYVRICSNVGANAWGYIEIDQGGRDNKIKIRSRLEDKGLRPVPVYHPINDGWDYFDYLASRYDRICVGNLVHAEAPERMRLLSTIFIRRQKYPHLWVHLLGVTPNELLHSCPLSSCDSSTWLSAIRWGFADEVALGKRCGGGFGPEMTYRYDSVDELLGETMGPNPSYSKATDLWAWDAELAGRNWAGYCKHYREAIA
jgi:hypothetical protein